MWYKALDLEVSVSLDTFLCTAFSTVTTECGPSLEVTKECFIAL